MKNLYYLLLLSLLFLVQCKNPNENRYKSPELDRKQDNHQDEEGEYLEEEAPSKSSYSSYDEEEESTMTKPEEDIIDDNSTVEEEEEKEIILKDYSEQSSFEPDTSS